MKREFKKLRPTLSFLAVAISLTLLVAGIGPISVTAVPVWSDNFNDGLFSEWTIRTGDFNITNYELMGTETGQPPYNYITRDGNGAQGIWEFDLHFRDNYWTEVVFASTGGTDAARGWSVSILNHVITLHKHNNGGWGAAAGEGQYVGSFGDFSDGIYHFEIKRNTTSNIYIWIDDELVIDSDHSSDETQYDHFGFMAYYGCSIDNIVIDDGTDPTTTTTTTTTTETTTTTSTTTTPTETSPTTPAPPPPAIPMELLLGGVAVVAVVVIIAVVVKVRGG